MRLFDRSVSSSPQASSQIASHLSSQVSPQALIACVFGLAFGPLALAACGSGGAPSTKDPASAESAESPEEARKRAIEAAKPRPELQDATVYDESGVAHKCEVPKPAERCPSTDTSMSFRDACKNAGFQARRCGCDFYCAGDVSAAAQKPFFDATGSARPCAKPDPDCTPTPPTAAFQDACNDKGHGLKVCGCEWLCTGNPSP